MNKEIETKLSIIKLGKIPRNYKRHNRDLLPLDWKSVKIEEVMNIKNNYRVPISESKRKTIQGIYPYYGPTKIQDYIDRYTLEGEHVLIGEDGDHFLKYKEKKMTLLVSGKFNVNNHAHIIQGTKLCDTKWFYYVFQHKNILDSVTRQGVGRYKLTKGALRNIEFSLPKLSEQQNIIRILEVWDKSIDLKEKLLQQKQKQKKGLMQRLLTGKIRLKGFKDKWDTVKLGSAIDVIKKESLSNPQEYNLLTVKLHVKGIEATDKKPNTTEKGRPYYLREPGELLIGRQNFHNGGIGIVPQDMKGYIASNAITSLKVINEDLKFYFHYLSNSSFYKRVDNIIGGTGQKEISETMLKKLKVKVPRNINEQRAIAKVISVADYEVKLLEKEIELLKEQKKGLMQLLLTGIVRVKCD
ncbi:restriction endonuclease subunit S [Clostridium tetani]|uniref:restriction endonuclease subunit S n=1 Tax=Clostridium tetani TaxID=1513 RepID=UPI0013E93C69|nr:restriction endonuclease subunit S [Clostridium tetani]